MLAERAGLRIHEVPVDWIDDADSRVHIIATALADLRGIIRLGTGLARGTISVPVLGNPSPPALRPQAGDPRAGRYGQLARFVVVGVASTAAYVLLYLLFCGVMTAQAANAISLLLTAVANTAVNRRFTFGIRGRMHAARHQLRGLIAFGIGLAVTSRRAGRAARRVRPAQPRRRGRACSSRPTWSPPWSGSRSTGAGSSAATAAARARRPGSQSPPARGARPETAPISSSTSCWTCPNRS